jgi:hypothetical protein
MGKPRSDAPDVNGGDVTIEELIWLLLGSVIGLAAGFTILARSGLLRLRRLRRPRWRR